MKKYTVPVARIGYSMMDIEVEAENEEEAIEKAIEEAGNHVFSEHSSDYEADDAYEKDD